MIILCCGARSRDHVMTSPSARTLWASIPDARGNHIISRNVAAQDKEMIGTAEKLALRM